MSIATQPGPGELLPALGSSPRGRKRDSPWCGGRGTVSVNEAKGLFCCHHAGCDFHGDMGTLRRLLNLPPGGAHPSYHASAIEAEERKRAADAAQRAWGLWRRLNPCPESHPYLRKKKITPHGARLHAGRIVLPVMDADDRLLSLQFISSDGEKLFFSGTRVAGGFALMGEPALRLYICEGFATGVSLFEATGDAVVVAFSAGNLPAVTQTMRWRFPHAEITIAADHDDAGIREARKAAAAVGADIALPETPGADWNDTWVSGGAEAVLVGLDNAMKAAL